MNTTQKPETYVVHLDELVQRVDDALPYSHADTNRALRILRAVLWAIRDRLEFEPAIHFLDQLPLPLKAIYLDRWVVDKRAPERLHTLDDLIDEMMQEDSALFEAFSHGREEIRQTVVAVFRVINAYLSPNKVEIELNFLPEDVKAWVTQSTKNEELWSNTESSIWLS